MKYLKKISSLSFLVLAVFFCCSFFGTLKIKNVNAENNDNIILSVNQISKTIQSEEPFITISGTSDAENLYNNLSLIESKLNVNTVIENNEVVLLDSENDCVLVTLLPKNDTGYTLSSLNVNLKINGIIVQVQTYSPTSTLNNSVYLQAFDFSQLLNNMGEQISPSDMDGLYEFEFSYSYSYYDKGVYRVENDTKSICFYLLNQSEYLNDSNEAKIKYTYFNSKVFEAKENRKTTYFYNYSSKNPVISFNPYNYNLNIKYSYKEEDVNLTGTYKLDNNGDIESYTLVSDNENIIHSIKATITKSSTATETTCSLELNKLGFYDISYEFVFKNNNILTVLGGDDIADVVEKNFSELGGSNVYIYGYEAYYKDYANATNVQDAKYEQFYTDEIKTDFSSVLTDETNLTNANDLFALAKNNNYAITNQAQVKLNDYASLVNGYYYYTENENFDNNTQIQYTNSTRFTENGKYVVVLQYNFSKYDELNKQESSSSTEYENVQFTQLIVFEIQNTTPTLNLNVGNGDNFTDSLNKNGFTNQNVQVSWENYANNPFILQPKLTFRKNNVTLNDVQIKEADVNSVIFTENGNYIIELRYGLGYSTIIEKTFTIDKTEIEYNLLFDFKSDETYTTQTKSELTIEDNYAIKTLNSSFALQVNTKEIESNTITATYSYIPLTKINIEAKNALIELNGKYYIQNGYELSTTIFKNIDYTYCETLQNITATNKINANGLYKFVLTDKAGNKQSIFVFLDNTTPSVLQISEEIENLELTETQRGKLSYKASEMNFISENYSLIFGSGKAIKLNTTDDTSELVTKFISLNESEIQGEFKIFAHKNSTCTSEKLIQDNESDNYTKSEVGFMAVTRPAGEVDRKYTLNLTDYFNNKNSYQFELNTDKTLVMIWAKNKVETSLNRILPNSSTNKEEIYIRYQNDYISTNYEIDSLTLKFFNYNSDYTGFNNIESKTFNLLNSSVVNTNTVNNISGGYITNTYVNAHYDKNALSVTQAGKYEITRTYKNGDSQTYIFYVDRFKPIERVDSTNIIGSNLIFKLGEKEKQLKAETILNYITNNQALKTNFKLVSLPNVTNKYSNIEAFKLNYTISLLKIDGSYNELFNGSSEQYNANNVFKTYGTYKIRISDLSNNYTEFSINYTDEFVKGNYVTKDNNVISENNACTASNELYFVFESAENEFMCNVDIYNIELYANNLLILKTSKDKTTEYKGTFSFDGLNVYYKSPYYSSNSRMFNLTRELISGARYKYTLTILNGDFLNSSNPLYLNGESAELTYLIKLTYEEGSNIVSEKTINIDHTSPTENAQTLINNDKYLTDEEKTELLESIKNKDNNYTIHFENYVLTADENFSFKTNSTNIKETSLIYYRKYDKFATTKTIDNYQSLVPSDINFGGTITNRYRFNANLQNDAGQRVYSNIATTKLNSPLKEIFGVDYGCYEIIEIDSAENYTIYSIQYINSNNLSIEFEAYETKGEVNANNNNVEINDVDLKLTSINVLTNENNNLADFINVTVKTGNKTQVLRLSASEIENQLNNTDDLLARINLIIQENENENYGVSYTLTFQARYGDPIVLSYNEPQDELQLVWQDYENRFVVTVPQSQGATSIKEFSVYPAIKEDKQIIVSGVALDKDSNGQTIIQKETETSFVGGKSYLFTNSVTIDNVQKKVYVYKVVWKDNFGRENSAFKVIGIIDAHELIYNGPTATINEKTYTYQDVILHYQMQSYNLQISIKNLNTDRMENLDISQINGDANSIADVNLLDYLKQYGWVNNQVEYTINLTSILEENGVAQTYNYSFIYYPLIPEIIFTDSSNSELQPAKSTDINFETYLLTTSKNVTISFENSVFPVNVNYSLTYLANNNNLTENYNNVSTETTLTKVGTYLITITNSLGKSVTYRFAIREASLYPYAVIVSQLGVTNYELTPSQVPLELTIDGAPKTIDTYFTIYDTTIEVNADNNLYYKEITDTNNIAGIPTNYENYIKIYLIEPKNNTSNANKIYIAVVKVPYTDDLLMLNESDTDKQLLKLYTSSSDKAEQINKYSFVATEKDGAKLTLSKNYNTFEGNTISTKIYFNNKLVNISFAETVNTYELKLTEAGTYDIYFEDFAGNNQLFKGNSFLRVIVLNKVIANLNGDNYVDYQIFNSPVYISILQANLYSTKSFSISALLNGVDYNKNITSSNGQYVFSKAGLYTVTLKAKYNNIDIETIIHFIIINPNIAYSSFSYVGLNGYTISKIERNNEDITNDLKVFFKYGLEFERTEIENEYSNGAQTINANNIYLNNINLASKLSFKRNVELEATDEETENNEVYDYISGSGKYNITVLIDNGSVLNSTTFTFSVWIREENTNIVIKPSIKEGGSTTKTINITFNPYLIYTQIGECTIVANDIVLYTINANSVNEKITIDLPEENTTYTVQLKSEENVEMSFGVTKKEPLSTVSIIVICIASVILGVAIFVFLKLRIKMKVK